MEDLVTLQNELHAIPMLEAKQRRLDKQLQDAEAALYKLLKQCEAENHDVEALQKERISSFFLKLTGRYEDRLAKETCEAIEAKRQYDHADACRLQLRKDRDEINAALVELRRLASRYEAELNRRHQLIRQGMYDGDAEAYNAFDVRMTETACQRKEVDEAKRAAIRARDVAANALEALRKAEGWATYDVWAGKGLLSHAAKYARLDEAASLFDKLSAQLESLRRELADVKDLPMPKLTDVSSTERFVDFWFDNIFTDLSVRNQIRENIDKMDKLMAALGKLVSTLEAKEKRLRTQIEEAKQAQEEWLVQNDF